MKDKKKKRMIFNMSCIIGIVILTAYNLSGCVLLIRTRRTYEQAFKLNWNIVLPGNMINEFAEAEQSFSGEGIRYAVFRLTEEPVDFVADFSREKDEKFENKVNKVICRAEFKVPESFLPDWEAGYYWMHTGNRNQDGSFSDDLYMIYFPDSIKLVLCEDIR